MVVRDDVEVDANPALRTLPPKLAVRQIRQLAAGFILNECYTLVHIVL